MKIRENQIDVYVRLETPGRRHAQTARERAWCDGPPRRYEVAFQETERLLREMEVESLNH